MSIYCKCCHKHWKLKTEYDKHLTCCEYFYQLRRNPDMDDFGCKLPNQRELFRLIQDLATKCSHLEKEVSRLKNTMNTRNKKAIVDCLHQPSQRPDRTFPEWWKQISVDRAQLEMVFRTDLTDGMKSAIECRLHASSPRLIPIRAFIQKPNVFYIYVGVGVGAAGADPSKPNGGSGSPWKIMHNEEMESMVLYLSQLFLKEFIQWQRDMAESTQNRTYDMDRELHYMMKINGTKTSTEKRMLEIKKWLFPKIQENIMDLTVEFV